MFAIINGFISRYGLIGVGILMLIENLIPAIPSELILPLAGYEAARGAFNPIAAVAVSTAGTVVGGCAWYIVGRRFGLVRAMDWVDRGGRWTTITPSALQKGHVWFRRWGGWALLLGRTLPGVRSFICVPAGIAGQPLAPFLAWSSAGAAIWSALLIASGYLLKENYELVRGWIDPVLDGVIAVCVITYLVRVIRLKQPET